MNRYRSMFASFLVCTLLPAAILAQVGLSGPDDGAQATPVKRGHTKAKSTPAPAKPGTLDMQAIADNLNGIRTGRSETQVRSMRMSGNMDLGNAGSGALNALANVMVERAEQTLLLDFMKHFKDILSKEVLPGTSLDKLFPKTHSLLSTALQPGVPIALGTVLNAAFTSDIKCLPENLAGAMAKNVDLIHGLSPEDQKGISDDFDEMGQAVSQLVNGSFNKNNPPSPLYSAILANSVDVVRRVGVADRTVGDIYKYGGFMVAVVVSQNPADLQSAIDGAVLPAGGYAEKASHELFINSYLGGNLGWERLDGAQPANMDLFAANGFGGMFAPVGLEWALAHQNLRLFASVLDLGALASFRLQDTTTNVTIGVQQVVSPGLFAVSDLFLGEGLSLGAGAQVAPQLRSVSVGGNTLSSNAVRAEVFLAMDIPLITLR